MGSMCSGPWVTEVITIVLFPFIHSNTPEIPLEVSPRGTLVLCAQGDTRMDIHGQNDEHLKNYHHWTTPSSRGCSVWFLCSSLSSTYMLIQSTQDRGQHIRGRGSEEGAVIELLWGACPSPTAGRSERFMDRKPRLHRARVRMTNVSSFLQ